MKWLFTLAMTTIFSIFATAVMSYTALATPIGPWIMPTVALCVMLFAKLIQLQHPSQSVALVSIGASMGGIVATACAFSFPTLHFLDPELFAQWIAQPAFFAAVMGGLSFSAGALGILVAYYFDHRLIVEQQLAFPIGQLTHQLIKATSNQLSKAYELLVGFGGTVLFCVMQDGLGAFAGFIPKNFMLIPPISIALFRIPAIQVELWPMLWAIGFVAGYIIAIPLAVGAIAKLFLADPIHAIWFSHLSSVEFILAFCSGMVLCGALLGFASLPRMLVTGAAWLKATLVTVQQKKVMKEVTNQHLFIGVAWAISLTLGCLFLRFFAFSWLSILFLYVGTVACMQQVATIAGKYGLAPLGRFATFVMIPAMLLFKLDFVQIVLVATFVEIAVGVVADVLFGRKLARLMEIRTATAWQYHVIGLVMSSLAVGIIFWLLINHFKLGSTELFAYKAQSRQLLIHARQFELYVLLIGALFAFILRRFKVNAMLVLGGLLMPINFSLGLVIGGLLTLFVKEREEWEPFWSGVFASNSLWMLFKAAFDR